MGQSKEEDAGVGRARRCHTREGFALLCRALSSFVSQPAERSCTGLQLARTPLSPLPAHPLPPPRLNAGGLAGFAHGVKRGVLGFVVIPLASLLEMSARMADSIRRAVAGTSCLSWVRPPR